MEDQAARGVRTEWAEGWPAVVVGLAGMALVNIASFTLGLQMPQLEKAFGWTRTEVSSGLIVFAGVALFATPLAGRLADRWGTRKVAIPGTLLMGATFAALGLADGSLWQWWLLWFLFALAAAAANPAIWASLISRTFVAGRGLAIGVMMCGAALGALTIPPITRWSIDSFGWRAAYANVGLGYGLVTCLLVVLLVRESRRPTAATAETAAPPADAAGLTFGEAVRDPAVIKILAGIFLIITLFVALIVHMIPILIDRGVDRNAATLLASGLGIGSVVGKLGIGWLNDRGRGRLLIPLCFMVPALASVMLLLVNGSVFVAALAILVTGLGSGSVLQLSADLTARYAGLRSFAQIYGLVGGLMAVSGGLGPVLGAVVFDRSGGYAAMLIGAVPFALAIGAMMATLGRQPRFEASPDGLVEAMA